MLQASVQMCMESFEKSSGLWLHIRFPKHIQNVPRCIQCHHSTDRGPRRNVNLFSSCSHKKAAESPCSYCLNTSFSFSHQVSSVGEDNSRKQTLFLTCSWRLWASACWSSCSSLSLSISYCCSQSTSPWEPSGVLFSLFSSKSLVISVKLAGPEESESTVMISQVLRLLPAKPSSNYHNPCSTVTSIDRESSPAIKKPHKSQMEKNSKAQPYTYFNRCKMNHLINPWTCSLLSLLCSLRNSNFN